MLGMPKKLATQPPPDKEKPTRHSPISILTTMLPLFFANTPEVCDVFAFQIRRRRVVGCV